MTYAAPEENTLGVPIRIPRSRRMVKPGRARSGGRGFSIPRSTLGTSYLALGASVIVAVRAAVGLVQFLLQLGDSPRPVLAVAAWVVLVSAGLGAAVAVRFTGDRMPNWAFAWFLFGLAGAVVLDLVSIWDLHDIGAHATASVVAGMALLLVLTRRGPIELLVTALLLGLVLSVAIAVETQPGPDALARQITAVAFAVLPVVIGVAVITDFRRMVEREHERVIVQGTVSAPRFAVGMLASAELKRLDETAEELLDGIASGRTPLPLDPTTASTAASLATELRLHLLENRRETWLYHAITESELLGKSVTLRDPGSLAGLLEQNQRDGLLSAVWMLVSDQPVAEHGRGMEIVLGPLDDAGSTADHLCVPISISFPGVPRNRIDPSVWAALKRVGQYRDAADFSGLRVAIEGMVDRPRDVERSRV